MQPQSDKLAVLHILEATTGGTRRHLVDLTTALDKQAFDVSVVCATRRDPAFLPDIDRMRAAGVSVTVIPMIRSISPVRDTIALVRILRFIKQHSFDIVHTHSSKAGFLGRIAARLAHVPAVVHTPHVFAFQMDVHPFVRSSYRRLEKLVAPFTSRFICVCADEKEAAVRAGLAPADRFTVITNGVGTPDAGASALPTELNIEPGTIVIGTIGRLTRQKGHQYLVRAAKQVIDKSPEARFLIVGTGELKTELALLIDALSLQDKVRIIDVNDGFASFYPVIDIFVSPSAWEGMPYALLDAMSHGNAIVATRVGGVPEAITDGETGVLAPPNRASALAEAITRLLGDTELRTRLGMNAKNAVAGNFSLGQMVKATEDLYRDLTRQPAPATIET